MIRLATALALAATAALVTPSSVAAASAERTPSAEALSERRAFALSHRVAPDVPVPDAPARASQADGSADVAASSSGDGCLRDPQSEPRDASALDISSTSLVRCDSDPQSFVLRVETYDAWATDRLDGLFITLDTDVNAGTGCDGDDFFVIGYDDRDLGLIADVVQTPDCDDNGWSYRGEARIDRANRTDFVKMSWQAAQIDSPRAVRYITDTSDGSSFDIAPDSGSYLLSPDSPPPPPKSYPTPEARDITDTCDRQVGTPFIDTIGTTHEYSINCVSGRRITSGSTPVTYEPNGTLTRGQTATFLVNTLRAAGYSPQMTESLCREEDVHADNMTRLIEARIIPRPEDGICSPAVTIDRELMAMWTRNALRYAFKPGEAGTDWFSDDDTSDHEGHINEITSLGIVTGKGNGLYGPEESLTRGQMATFLARSLDTILN